MISWIEVCERIGETAWSEGFTEVKKEKVISDVLRDNPSKRLSKKRDVQAVVEAGEMADLTALEGYTSEEARNPSIFTCK